MNHRPILAAFLSLFVCAAASAQEKGEAVERADWGAVARQPGEGKVVIAVDTMPVHEIVALPSVIESIVGVYVDEPGRIGPGKLRRVGVGYMDDGKKMALYPPTEAGKACVIIVETASKSGQQSDGRIIFTAADAKINPAEGATKTEAKYLTDGSNQRIKFWSKLEETISWDFTATRPGMYDIELTYALSEGPCKVRATIGEANVEAELKRMAGVDTYLTVTLGKVYIKSPTKHSLLLKTLERERFGASIKAVMLRPTGEGKPVTQNEDGSLLLHSRDATSHGTKVQYEHNPKKDTLGYWVNVSDQAYWTFTVTKPGTFDVEILQGCGKGSGNAEVAMVLLEGTGFGKDQTLNFTVQDTGHFQNFVPRNIGQLKFEKAGEYTFLVKPLKKPGVAVMDLRQVKMTPVK